MISKEASVKPFHLLTGARQYWRMFKMYNQGYSVFLTQGCLGTRENQFSWLILCAGLLYAKKKKNILAQKDFLKLRYLFSRVEVAF